MHGHNRRAFLTTLGGFATMASTVAAQPPAPAPSNIDITWLDRFKGKHKQVFDLGSFDLSVDSPLRQPVTYMSVHREISKLEPPDDVNVLVAISHRSFPLNAGDALWEKFKIGEVWNIKDPSTGKPATRNVFLGPATGAPAATVRGLQARGAAFWQCNFALNAVAGELAEKSGGQQPDVRAELLAGLNPGVKLVPAHTWAIGYAQEHGFTYENL